MRKMALVLSATFLFAVSPCQAQSEWQELKGDHFIVYYQTDERFARTILRQSEYYYDRVARDLGYTRYENFWKWERRAKIYIYADRESYLRATSQPVWSVGSANYSRKEVISYSGCQAFVDETLPHEIAHLIFRDFVGFENAIPLWLDEGVAQRQEESKQKVLDYYVVDLVRGRRLWSLSRLTRADFGAIQNEEDALVFYIQAASLVSFLIERHGADSFVQLCRQLRDGKPLDEALQFVYPTKMRDLQELEKAWLEYVGGLRPSVRPSVEPQVRRRVLVVLPQ